MLWNAATVFFACHTGIDDFSAAAPAHDRMRRDAADRDADITFYYLGIHKDFAAVRRISDIGLLALVMKLGIDNSVVFVHFLANFRNHLFRCHVSMTAQRHDDDNILFSDSPLMQPLQKDGQDDVCRGWSCSVITQNGNRLSRLYNFFQFRRADRILHCFDNHFTARSMFRGFCLFRRKHLYMKMIGNMKAQLFISIRQINFHGFLLLRSKCVLSP